MLCAPSNRAEVVQVAVPPPPDFTVGVMAEQPEMAVPSDENDTVLVLIRVKIRQDLSPGDMVEVDDEEGERLIARGHATSMETWQARAAAEKIDDPWE